MIAGEVAELVNGTLEGNPSLEIVGVGKIETAAKNEITFISNPLYEKFFETTSAGAVIVSNEFSSKKSRQDISLIRVADPYRAFLKIVSLFTEEESGYQSGISSTAVICQDVVIEADVLISDFCRIGNYSYIGADTKIYSGCIIEDNVKIGTGCIIHPNVTIYRKCIIGNNVIIHSGTVIGSDGFGFAKKEDGSYDKIPQTGNVVIEDDVEIGSCCSIDRASIGETRIGKGVKLDNQIQIAHNVTIGENTVIAAQVGIAGSTKIGKRCMIGGQSGIVGHITICDDVMIGASVGVSKSIDKPGLYTGYRAKPNIENLKQEAILDMLKQNSTSLSKILKNK